MPNGSHSNLFVFHQAIPQQGRLWCGVTENHSLGNRRIGPRYRDDRLALGGRIQRQGLLLSPGVRGQRHALLQYL